MPKTEKFIDANYIYNNPFAKEITDRAANIAIKNNTEDKYTDYVMQVFQLFSEICSKFDDYNYIYLHITNYPKKWILREKITNYNYIRYHTEIYAINVIAIFDRILQLINFLYDLKLEQNNIKTKNIIKKNIVDDEIKKVLIKFEEWTKELRILQNQIKHKEWLSIKELDKIQVTDFILRHSKDIDNRKVLELIVKLWIKKYLKERSPQFLENSKAIASYINHIFGCLYPILKSNLNKIIPETVTQSEEPQIN